MKTGRRGLIGYLFYISINWGIWHTGKMHDLNYTTQSFKNPHLRICLLIFRERKGGREWGRKKERKRNIDVREKHWFVASCMHFNWGLNLQPSYVLWLGIEPTIFWCTGRFQLTEPPGQCTTEWIFKLVCETTIVLSVLLAPCSTHPNPFSRLLPEDLIKYDLTQW